MKRSSYWTCQAAFAVFAVMAGCVLGGRTALKHGIECFAGPPYLVLGQVQSLGAGSGPSVTLASVGTWEGPPVRSAAGASPEKLPGSPQTEKGSGEGEEPKGGGVFKLINFVILAGALVYLLRKPLGSFLAQRSDPFLKFGYFFARLLGIRHLSSPSGVSDLLKLILAAESAENSGARKNDSRTEFHPG